MSHLEHETLWSLSSGALLPAEAAAARAHLEGCASCSSASQDVVFAQLALSAMPEVPALPAAMATSVGAALVEAFAVELQGHVAREALWELDAAADPAHLERCASCREALEATREARRAVTLSDEVPALPPAMATSVGAALVEAFAVELQGHVAREALWELDAAAAPAHLEACASCRARLEEVREARLMVVPVEAPPLPAAIAARVGERLARWSLAEAEPTDALSAAELRSPVTRAREDAAEATGVLAPGRARLAVELPSSREDAAEATGVLPPARALLAVELPSSREDTAEATGVLAPGRALLADELQSSATRAREDAVEAVHATLPAARANAPEAPTGHPDPDELWTYAGGEAPLALRVTLVQHLKACESCRAALADVQVAREALAAVPEAPPLPAALATRLAARLELSAAHLEPDALWGLSKGTLARADADVARLHLEQCARCADAFSEVQAAQQSVAQLPAVPRMPDAMARRVGARLAEEADRRAARSFTGWWASLFTPRLGFALVAAAVVIGIAWVVAPRAPAPAPIAHRDEQPLPPALPVPTPPLPKEAPPTLAQAPRRHVTVASARKASAQKEAVLDEGAVVSTQKGGSVWMQLPDGTRAGLTSASQVTLARLEDKALTLDVAHGSLAMVVPHREDRVLTVRAGDLTVTDLGTRFVVSRERSAVVVMVEEGRVEVETPAGKREVGAGHVVTWKHGTLEDHHLPPPAVEPAPTAAVVDPTPAVAAVPENSVAKVEPQDTGDAPPPPEALPDEPEGPPSSPEAWNTLPTKTEKQLPPVSAFTPTPPRTATTGTEREFSLHNVERRLREFGSTLSTRTGREARARNVALSADSNDCQYALKLADAWLAEPVTRLPNEPTLQRWVQSARVKCLEQLGRHDEAEAQRKTFKP